MGTSLGVHSLANCFLPCGSLHICIHSWRVFWVGKIVPRQLSSCGLFFLLQSSPCCGCASIRSLMTQQKLHQMVNVASIVSSFQRKNLSFVETGISLHLLCVYTRNQVKSSTELLCTVSTSEKGVWWKKTERTLVYVFCCPFDKVFVVPCWNMFLELWS